MYILSKEEKYKRRKTMKKKNKLTGWELKASKGRIVVLVVLTTTVIKA